MDPRGIVASSKSREMRSYTTHWVLASALFWALIFLYYTSWKQQLPEVVHRPRHSTFIAAAFHHFGGDNSASAPPVIRLGSHCPALAAGDQPFSWEATCTMSSHNGIPARPRVGREARVDSAQALHLAGKCGRRWPLYVFPVWWPGKRSFVKLSTLCQMRRAVRNGRT